MFSNSAFLPCFRSAALTAEGADYVEGMLAAVAARGGLGMAHGRAAHWLRLAGRLLLGHLSCWQAVDGSPRRLPHPAVLASRWADEAHGDSSGSRHLVSSSASRVHRSPRRGKRSATPAAVTEKMMAGGGGRGGGSGGGGGSRPAPTAASLHGLSRADSSAAQSVFGSRPTPSIALPNGPMTPTLLFAAPTAIVGEDDGDGDLSPFDRAIRGTVSPPGSTGQAVRHAGAERRQPAKPAPEHVGLFYVAGGGRRARAHGSSRPVTSSYSQRLGAIGGGGGRPATVGERAAQRREDRGWISSFGRRKPKEGGLDWGQRQPGARGGGQLSPLQGGGSRPASTPLVRAACF